LTLEILPYKPRHVKGANMLEQLIEKLLNDDDGISHDAYIALINYLNQIERKDLVKEITSKTVSADGRFFFPEE